MKRCVRCSAPEKSTIHQVNHSNSEIRKAAHTFVHANSTKDAIVGILKQGLNYYERDDRDHYFYLAEREDIENVAQEISNYVHDALQRKP